MQDCDEKVREELLESVQASMRMQDREARAQTSQTRLAAFRLSVLPLFSAQSFACCFFTHQLYVLPDVQYQALVCTIIL